MTETAYLKDQLGGVLAKGLAAVAIARPQDPVEYLALWLLHYIQSKERRAKSTDVTRQLENEREEWAKGRAMREKAATAIIQREWRAHIRAQQESQQKEAELRQVFARIEETADEKAPAEDAAKEGGAAAGENEAERAAEAERTAAQAQFHRAKLFVAELDKSYVADFKRLQPANTSGVTVLKCCFYLMGLRPHQVDSWEKLRNLIKPYPFTQWLNSFQPCGTPLEKKRKMVRVRRLLTTVQDEAVKNAGAALYAVYQWVSAAVAFRDARDAFVKLRRTAGKEGEEELDEEEEAEDEEKDPEEEVIKAAELEAKKKAEQEAAAENAENPPAAEGAEGE